MSTKKDGKSGHVVKTVKLDPQSVQAAKEEASRPKQEDFIREYNALCKRMGWQLAAQPALKPMNDLGGSIIIVQLMIIPYKEPG